MESKRFQIYKCPVCDTVVEVLHQVSLELVCCGPAMVPVRAKTRQEGWEDHTPAVEEVQGGYRISVGESPHPMTKAHRIEWIEVVADGRSHRQFLSPGQAAEVVFAVKSLDAVIRLYCTAHGLWQSTLAKAQVGTIRLKLLKIGGRIVRSVRRVVVHLASAFPLQDLLRTVVDQLRDWRCLPNVGP